MHKCYLLSILLFANATALKAQKIIYEQDFELFNSYSITAGWNTSQYTGNQRWQTGILYLLNGDCFCTRMPQELTYHKVAGITDCIPRAGDNSNVFMYTPRLDLSGRTRAFLKFDSYFRNYTNGSIYEKAHVEISPNGGATWDVLSPIPTNPDLTKFYTLYFDISNYTGFSDVRAGFRYNDGGGGSVGWAVDNISVFEPLNNDLQLVSITPEDSMLSYLPINTGMPHVFKLFNAGLDTVHQFVLNYRQDNGAVKSDTIKNVNLPRFTITYITHAVKDTVTGIGKHHVTAWVSMEGDTLTWNDTAEADINGAYFMPQKLVAVEEGTATWDAFAVAGHVYMKQLASPGYDACQVAIHDNDPMMNAIIDKYNHYLFDIDQNYVPYFVLDRRHHAIYPDSIFSEVKKRQEYFGYADIQIEPTLKGNSFDVAVTVTPAIDLQGDHRVILVITEDEVSGTGATWAQFNAYSGGKQGRPMGGYENKANPVPASEMIYQYVARSVYPSAEGKTNLPATMEHNKGYRVNFNAMLDPTWNRDKLRANVFLIRQSDSSIINSNKILFYLGISERQAMFESAFAYPNPANEKTTIQFTTPGQEKISLQLTDISGRLLVEQPLQYYNAGVNKVDISTANLSPGIYLVNLMCGNERKVFKLQVVH